MPPIQSARDAFLQLWGQAIVYLHNIIGALIWLIIGYIVARVVRTILIKGLRAIHFDQITDRVGVGRALQAAGTKLDAAAVLAAVACVAFWWISLYFIENAFTVLGFAQATLFINQALGYLLPNIFAAIIIVIVGGLIANVAAGIVRGAASEARLSTGDLRGGIALGHHLVRGALGANAAQHRAEHDLHPVRRYR